MTTTKDYEDAFKRACFDRLYNSSSDTRIPSIPSSSSSSSSSLPAVQIDLVELDLSKISTSLNTLNQDASLQQQEINDHTILELAIKKMNVALLREMFDALKSINIADQARILGVKSDLDLAPIQNQDDIADINGWLFTLVEEMSPIDFDVSKDKHDPESNIGTLIRKEKEAQLRSCLSHLSNGTRDQKFADGWILEDKHKYKEQVKTNDINIFFMGTAGAPLFAGHFDIYEGGDVLCNLALQKALEEKKRVMLMRGVGTAVMSLDQPLVYLDHYDSKHNDKLAVTEGDVAGNLLGSGIEARITTAMEMHFIPEMIKLITDGLNKIKVNVTGHSRGAITSFAMADCMDKWMQSLSGLTDEQIETLANSIVEKNKHSQQNKDIEQQIRTELTKKNPAIEQKEITTALKQNQAIEQQNIIAALKKIRNNEIQLKTKLLAYDPVEGRAGLGNVKDGYLGWTANYNLPIYGQSIAFTYEEMPSTVADAFILLADADYREAFQPTIPTFEPTTKQKVMSVVGGHGTMKGNLSDHSNNGQDSYKIAQTSRFIKEAGRASIEFNRADAIEYLFADNLPSFQTTTLFNIFSANSNVADNVSYFLVNDKYDKNDFPKGYTRTKQAFLTALGKSTEDFESEYGPIFLKLKTNAQFSDADTLKIQNFFTECKLKMAADSNLTKQLYFLLKKDIYEIYFNPNDPEKQKLLGDWFKEMKLDTTNVSRRIKLLTTDSEGERYIWVRDNDNKKEYMQLSKRYPNLEFQPKKQMWYPETSYVGGVDSSKRAHKFNNPYWFDFENYFLSRGISTERMTDTLMSTSMQFLDLNEIGMRLLYAPSHPELLRAFEEKSAAFIKHVQENADYPDDIKTEIIAVFKMKAIYQYKMEEAFINDLIHNNSVQINTVDQKMHNYQLETISRLVSQYPEELGATSRKYGKILKEVQKLLKEGKEKKWITEVMAADGEFGAATMVGTGRYDFLGKPIPSDVTKLLNDDGIIQQYIQLSRQIDKYVKAIYKNEMLGYNTKLGAYFGGVFFSKVNSASFKKALKEIHADLSRLSIAEPDAQEKLNVLENQLRQISEANKKDAGSLIEKSTLQRYDLAKEIIKKISHTPNSEESKEAQINRVLSEECGNRSANPNDVLCEVFLQCLKKNETLVYSKKILNSELWENMKKSPRAKSLLQEVLNRDATPFNQGLIRDLVNKDFEHDLFNGAVLHEIVLIDKIADLVVGLLKTAEGKAQCNALNDNGETVLHVLAKNGRLDVLNAIENCEDLKVPRGGSWNISGKLYDGIYSVFGANLGANGLKIVENKDGLSPVMCAIFSSTAANYADVCGVIELLAGKTVNAEGDDKITKYKELAQHLQDKSPEERDALKEKFKQDKNLDGLLAACNPTQSSSSSNAVAPKKGWW
ncbi:hypothetical protein CC99x_006360 [Candidatus Berkiella cookevillensis]|uniref:Uncharacterized protein n=1 Tax=Candidatus Berkiella cookevillensis TaxID=437022 RepID=A0A0Q9YQC1_9GAMM|nr:hypothetical protein [Candidatus Berkiella cookevillensis]MCS5708529.1 hypothetical protein [Candidatus Berkiella cookevillensis]